MRRLKYHVASTVDGFNAHADGKVDGFLTEVDHVTDYLASLKKDYGSAIIGRPTYEFCFQFGVTNSYPWLKQYVVSRSMKESPDPNVELISEDAVTFVTNLKRQAGKDVYLCGGSELAGVLLE